MWYAQFFNMNTIGHRSELDDYMTNEYIEKGANKAFRISQLFRVNLKIYEQVAR